MNESFTLVQPIRLSCGDVFERQTLKKHIKKNGHSSCPKCGTEISWAQIKSYIFNGTNQQIIPTNSNGFKFHVLGDDAEKEGGLTRVAIPKSLLQLERFEERFSAQNPGIKDWFISTLRTSLGENCNSLEPYKRQTIEMIVREMNVSELRSFFTAVVEELGDLENLCKILKWVLFYLPLDSRNKMCEALMQINFVPTYGLNRHMVATMFEAVLVQYDPLLVEMNEQEINYFNYILKQARPLEIFHFCEIFANKYSFEELEKFIEYVLPYLERTNLIILDQALINFIKTVKDDTLSKKLDAFQQQIEKLLSVNSELKKNRTTLITIIAISVLGLGGLSYYFFNKNAFLASALAKKTNQIVFKKPIIKTSLKDFAKSINRTAFLASVLAKKTNQTDFKNDIIKTYLLDLSKLIS